MASTYLGKGLQEPCDPFREAYIFGAPFGDVPDANNWNCVPTIWDETNSFDFTGIEPNHEGPVSLFVIYDVPPGPSHEVRFKWYRDSDSKLVADLPFTIPASETGWAWGYIYCYIGYVDPVIYGDIEIHANGSYHVDVLYDGGLISQTSFTVAGIPYTTIEITAPDSARQGETVNVSIKVTNILTYPFVVWSQCAAPDIGDYIIDETEVINNGQCKTYYSSFVMPDYTCKVRAYTYYEGSWYSDAYEEQTVTLLPPADYYHGLKVQGVGELALCDVGTHPLRIRKGGVTYGIELVATDDPNASAVRIRTPAGVRAIRKYT